MCDGNKTGSVIAIGVEGTPAEVEVFVSDSTGWVDTYAIAEKGLYNATYDEHWELLAVSVAVMDLSLKVGTKEVSSIAVGTHLGIDFASNLDENDCVDLRIIDPDGIELNQNPADPNQKFNDINVTQLLEYESLDESKRINTTGWDVGDHKLWVKTPSGGDYARGLDIISAMVTLTIFKEDILTPTLSPTPTPSPSPTPSPTPILTPTETDVVDDTFTLTPTPTPTATPTPSPTLTPTATPSPSLTPTPDEKKGSIDVSTRPSDASVYLDGNYKGETPMTISNVYAGPHTVRLTKRYYDNYEERVTVSADRPVTVTKDLERVWWIEDLPIMLAIISVIIGGIGLIRSRRRKGKKGGNSNSQND